MAAVSSGNLAVHRQPDFSTTLVQVRAARDGDREAAEQLFARYLPIVRGLAADRLGAGLRGFVEVEDVVQESMRDAFVGIDRLREESENHFLRWMVQIIENNIRDLHRRLEVRKRRGLQQLPESTDGTGLEHAIPAPDPSPTQCVRGAEVAEAQCRALTELNPRYRRVFVMRELRGMSFEDIAAELGYARPETVRVKLAAAKRRLRELMERFFTAT